VRSTRSSVIGFNVFIFLMVPIVITATPVGAVVCDSTAFAGGVGSLGEPFQVDNRVALEQVRNCAGQNFLQTTNIDLGDTEWDPIGDLTDPFFGTYDGDGNSITGLLITSSGNYRGLFGRVEFGTVKNVHVAGSITFSTASAFVGGLVGFLIGTVSNSSSSVLVSAPESDYVGGLAGGVSASNLEDSMASGSVVGKSRVGGLMGNVDGTSVIRSHSIGSVSGLDKVGGLLGGFGDGALLSNTYAHGSVTATMTGGGLIGDLSLTGVIEKSYAIGAVSASPSGGLIGLVDVQTDYTISGNLWDVGTTGLSVDGSSVGTVGRTTADMKLLSTFLSYGWDIDTSGELIWQICDGVNNNYPFLTSEGRNITSCSEPNPNRPPIHVPSSNSPSVLPTTGTGTSGLRFPIAIIAAGTALLMKVRRKRLGEAL